MRETIDILVPTITDDDKIPVPTITEDVVHPILANMERDSLPAPTIKNDS